MEESEEIVMDSLFAIHEKKFFFLVIACRRLAFPSRTRCRDFPIFRIFSPKVNCNFSHVIACMIYRFLARFSEKFFCKGVAGISFEFNCHAVIVKVHLLFKNLGTPRAVPLNFVSGKFQLAGLSLFHHFPHITKGITLPRFLSVRNIDFIACHFVISLTYLSTLFPSYFPIYPTSRESSPSFL